MSEHAFVAILGIAFTVVFLVGLLELTRLPEEEPEGQHEEEPEGQHEEEATEQRDQARRKSGSAKRRRKLRELLDDGVTNESEPEAKTAEDDS